MAGREDRARFEALVAPHLADARALARWLARSRADADDIVQEASVRAFRALESFSGDNPRAWVLAIVRNTAMTWLKQNRSSRVVPLDDLGANERLHAEQGGAAWPPSATPEADLIAAADAAQLERLIDELPIEFREPLVLRDIHGLSYRDIGRIIDVPLGTVMSRLARARRKLIARIRQTSAVEQPDIGRLRR